MPKKTRLQIIQESNSPDKEVLRNQLDREIDIRMLLPKPKIEEKDTIDIKVLPKAIPKRKPVRISPVPVASEPEAKKAEKKSKDCCIIL
jgi:hypothetical protein